jgi:PEP-CTERM motif
MMKLVLLISGMLCATSLGSAAVCVPGTLQSYIGLGSGGCQLGTLLFDNFAIASGQSIATPINPSQVQVTPGGSAFLPSLLFTLNSVAGPGAVFESFFRFQAVGLETGVSIALNNPTATGDGAVTGTLDVCRNGTFAGGAPIGCSGTSGSAIAFQIAGDSQLSDSAAFASSSFFDVFVDLTIDGGLAGTASLPSATVAVAAAPEPATLWLIAAGLILAGRRRQ